MASDILKTVCLAAIGAIDLSREKLSDIPETAKKTVDDLISRGERLNDTEDNLARALLAALKVSPRVPSDEEIDAIIPGYDDMKASEIVDQIKSITTKDLKTIRAYEYHNYNRIRILRHIDAELDEARIIPDYDNLPVGKVVEQLDDLSPQQLAALKDYEKSHRNRTTILKAIDRGLATA